MNLYDVGGWLERWESTDRSVCRTIGGLGIHGTLQACCDERFVDVGWVGELIPEHVLKFTSSDGGQDGVLICVLLRFIQRGFRFIRSWTWFRLADGLVVFDGYMDKLMDCDNELVPFDVIPILVQGPLLESLHAAVTRLDS